MKIVRRKANRAFKNIVNQYARTTNDFPRSNKWIPDCWSRSSPYLPVIYKLISPCKIDVRIHLGCLHDKRTGKDWYYVIAGVRSPRSYANVRTCSRAAEAATIKVLEDSTRQLFQSMYNLNAKKRKLIQH